MQYYTGTSGLLLPYKNKGFYPEGLQGKSRLHVYSLLFNSIEINSSFYKIPQKSTIAKWALDVTDSFRFTFKLWKGISHAKALQYQGADLEKFMDALAAAGDKCGCLLIQLPPSVSQSASLRLEKLLDNIAEVSDHKWNVCVEFRHATWYCENTYRVLDERQTGIVFHDKNSNGMNIDETAAPYIYLRFHGPEGNYRGSYDPVILEEYGQYIKEWLGSGKEVFSYFNNTMGGAITDLQYLRHIVSDSGT